MDSSYLFLILAITFNALDKWISRIFLKRTPSYNEYLFTYQSSCSLLSGLLIISELNQVSKQINSEVDLKFLLLLIVFSIISWMGFAYSTFRARTSIELGVVSIISKTKVIWSAIFGVSFLNEKLTFLQIVGVMLILVASLLISKNNKIGLLFSNNLHAWLAPIFLTIAIGIDKVLTMYLPSSIILFIGFSGTALLTPLLFKVHYGLIKKVLVNAVITATCGTASYYLLLKVLNTSSFSLVMALFQGAFILDILFGYFFLKEHTNLIRKIVSCLLATLGILTLAS
ncbi:EamA family transporter [Vibrio splendidus]|uniref:EamA family transporter n=1 Tax=Vibrio splendidus TaxID=29497 RepID=UPI002734838B|nr:EamA family transporter [Vibrio splendidus]MDP2592741.1 EamA family transporter [Vibrio splendidus]